MSKEEGQKKELLDLLSEAPAEASRLEKLAKEIEKSARFVREITPAIREYVEQVPADALPRSGWLHQIKGWQAWRESALRTSITLSSTFGATAYAATSASNTVLYIASSELRPTPELMAAQAKVNRILHRAPLLEEARASMCRLGLDQRGGGERPALDLLEEAQGALGSGATSALVTIRESIWAAIGQLNRRKPKQEAGSGPDMLPSIGRQCGWPHLDSRHFERLAVDWRALLKELSGGKQKAMSGEEVSELFDKALVFVNAFLRSIDNARLKPS